MVMVTGGVETLADDLDRTARWRREKAMQYPEDTRNLKAAEWLEGLAAELRSVVLIPHLKVLQEAVDGYIKAIDLSGETDSDSLSEQMDDYVRSIGFHMNPTVIDLLNDLRDMVHEATAAHAEEQGGRMSAEAHNEALAILKGLADEGVITGHGNIIHAGYGGRNDASYVTVRAPATADALEVEEAVKAALGHPWQVTVKAREPA